MVFTTNILELKPPLMVMESYVSCMGFHVGLAVRLAAKGSNDGIEDTEQGPTRGIADESRNCGYDL
jgi:hypothetical protein